MPADDRPGASISRRRLLAAAAVVAGGGASAALAGCGSSTPHRVRNAEFRAADADVLYALVGLAEQALATYRGAAGLLRGAERDLARRIGVQEAAHVYALSGAIYRLGGNAAPQPSSFRFAARDRAGALRLAAAVESMSVAAGIDALPKLADLQARGTVVSIAACDAQHALLIDQLRGGVSPYATALAGVG